MNKMLSFGSDLLVINVVERCQDSSRFIEITYNELLYLQIKDKMRDLNAALGSKAHRFVHVLVKFDGVLNFLHLTNQSNYESIKKNGLLVSKSYPEDGQSSISGIYCFRLDCPHALRGLGAVMGDYFPEPEDIPLVCCGYYSGEYYLVVNSPTDNYVILQNDAKVDRFYNLDWENGKLIPFEE